MRAISPRVALELCLSELRALSDADARQQDALRADAKRLLGKIDGLNQLDARMADDRADANAPLRVELPTNVRLNVDRL